MCVYNFEIDWILNLDAKMQMSAILVMSYVIYAGECQYFHIDDFLFLVH